MFVKCEHSRSSNHTEAFIDYFTENHCHDVAADQFSSQVQLLPGRCCLSHLADRDQRFQCGFPFCEPVA